MRAHLPLEGRDAAARVEEAEAARAGRHPQVEDAAHRRAHVHVAGVRAPALESGKGEGCSRAALGRLELAEARP